MHAIIELFQADFPHLWNIPDPPARLFAQGQPKALDLLMQLPERGLAIVGTRHPQLRTEKLVKSTVLELREKNLIILSGFAIGIDRVAHESALQAKLPTIGILGTPLTSSYPVENQQLRQEILKSGGLLITEFEASTTTHSWHFPRRNRLIAGWSQATWVAEAGQRSGALSTLQWCLKTAGRRCYVTPCFPSEIQYAGNQKWLSAEPRVETFWGTHSLGSTWLELAAMRPPQLEFFEKTRATEATPPIIPPDALNIAQAIQRLGGRQEALPVSMVLEHFLDQPDWNAQRFFQAAQVAIQAAIIIEKNGGWIAPI